MKIGVVGVGHLGKIHLKCIRQIADYQMTGIYDLSQEEAEKVAQEYNIKAYQSLDELMEASEVLCIVTPTTTNYAIADKIIQAGKNVFIEKSVKSNNQTGQKLQKLAEKAGVIVLVSKVM